MKKILLISDTHGYLDPKLIKHIQDSDEVWHAGDIGDISVCDEILKLCPLRAVQGNIDDHKIRAVYPEALNFNCEDVNVYMVHIGGYPGRYAPGIKKILTGLKPGLFVCGHSHILKVMPDKELGLLHINPGATGRSGMHTVKTAVKLTIEGDKFRDLAVIELGKRSSLT